jgi:hypothetical protein
MVICGLFYVIYGFFMAVLLIPNGVEDTGVFAFIIPVFLATLGVIHEVGSRMNQN